MLMWIPRKLKPVLILTAMVIVPVFLMAQDVPVPLGHPVYSFLDREITLGKVSGLSLGMRPYTWNEIQTALESLDRSLAPNAGERDLLKRYLAEFKLENTRPGLTGPWQKDKWRDLGSHVRSTGIEDKFPHFITYRDAEILGWVDWQESVRMESDGEHVRPLYKDQLTFQGSIADRISFLTEFTEHRLGYQEGFVPALPPEYKQGFLLVHSETQWRIWDHNRSTLRLSGDHLDFEISKEQIYWGFSRNDSPILSAQTASYPFLGLRFKYRGLRIMSFNGQLLPVNDPEREQDIPEKNIAGHRVELAFSKTFTMSFTEMVIYANRPPELGYLIPVNAFFTEEHLLGDRDNTLMALEASWLPLPGLRAYGTFFWDDISWFQVFDTWWGSKFLVQAGLHWVFSSNPAIPDVRLELSAARPWVYTHGDSINTFTHAEHGLGFPLGPNSQQLSLVTSIHPLPRLNIEAKLENQVKGSGLGSDPLDNYNDRDKDLDWETTWLMGDLTRSSNLYFSARYLLNTVLSLHGRIGYDSAGEQLWVYLGGQFNW